MFTADRKVYSDYQEMEKLMKKHKNIAKVAEIMHVSIDYLLSVKNHFDCCIE